MTTAPPLGDPDLMARWVAASSAREEFWSSAPAWTPDSAHRTVDGYLLVYTPGGILQVAPAPAVVATHFDGLATLTELAEDLAAAAEMDVDAVRPMVASVAVELRAWGAVAGVPVADLRTIDPDHDHDHDHGVSGIAAEVRGVREYTAIDPETGAEMRVEETVDAEGRRVVTEHLPGGGRQVTTYVEYRMGEHQSAAADAEDLAGELMDGRRSAAELVPPDSCLGSKLRNDDDVPLVSMRCADGIVRSVRCHDPEVARALEASAGEAAVAERGPVEAFVVTPLEGQGPLRIYDGRGRRRGRPRTTVEAVDVVDQVLGEAVARKAMGAPPMIVLNATVGTRDGRAQLLAADVMEDLPARRALAREGWTVSAAAAVLTLDGRVGLPRVFREGDVVPIDALVATPETADVPVRDIAAALVASVPVTAKPAAVLDLVVEVAAAMVHGRAGSKGATA